MRLWSGLRAMGFLAFAALGGSGCSTLQSPGQPVPVRLRAQWTRVASPGDSAVSRVSARLLDAAGQPRGAFQDLILESDHKTFHGSLAVPPLDSVSVQVVAFAGEDEFYRGQSAALFLQPRSVADAAVDMLPSVLLGLRGPITPVATGDSLDVRLVLQAPSGLGALQADLRFDPALLGLGRIISGAPGGVTLDSNQLLPGQLRILFYGTTLTPGLGGAGEQTLCTFRFAVLSLPPGQSPQPANLTTTLFLDRVVPAGRGRHAVPFEATNLQVELR